MSNNYYWLDRLMKSSDDKDDPDIHIGKTNHGGSWCKACDRIWIAGTCGESHASEYVWKFT